jgi:fucose permease
MGKVYIYPRKVIFRRAGMKKVLLVSLVAVAVALIIYITAQPASG